MKIVTHSGHFHTDDLLAVAMLLLIYPDAEVVRSRDEKVIESGDIVVDVGQIYDPKKMRFDHHQTAGAGRRENGIPYASAGLIWKEFGAELAGGRDETKIIEEKIIAPVDAIDNGISITEQLIEGIKPYTVGDYFESFAYGCETLEDYDSAFRRVLPLAIDLLKREIEIARSTAADWREVREIYSQSEDKKIIILPKRHHWKRILIPTEAMYVVSPRQDGKWISRAVPREINSFEVKKPFPMSWSGLVERNLAGVSGVSDATFCHRDCYMCIALSKEGAIKLAEIALNA